MKNNKADLFIILFVWLLFCWCVLSTPAAAAQPGKVLIIDSGVGKHYLIPEVTSDRWYDAANGYSQPYDSFGHGTFCAGRVLDAYPGAELYIANIRNSKGQYCTDAIILAIDWGIEKQVDVITISCGHDREYRPLSRAIERAIDANIIIVASVGNDNRDGIIWPAAHPGVIAVGATDSQGNRAKYSNYGPGLDVVAHGGSNREGLILGLAPNNRYVYGYGTSYSTPYVAGGIAKLRAQLPGFNAEIIKEIFYRQLEQRDPVDEYGRGIFKGAA